MPGKACVYSQSAENELRQTQLRIQTIKCYTWPSPALWHGWEKALLCPYKLTYPQQWKAVVILQAMMVPRSSNLQGTAFHLSLTAAASVAIFCPLNEPKGIPFSIQHTACIRQQKNRMCSLSLHLKAEEFKNYFSFSENVLPGNSKVQGFGFYSVNSWMSSMCWNSNSNLPLTATILLQPYSVICFPLLSATCCWKPLFVFFQCLPPPLYVEPFLAAPHRAKLPQSNQVRGPSLFLPFSASPGWWILVQQYASPRVTMMPIAIRKARKLFCKRNTEPMPGILFHVD